MTVQPKTISLKINVARRQHKITTDNCHFLNPYQSVCISMNPNWWLKLLSLPLYHFKCLLDSVLMWLLLFCTACSKWFLVAFNFLSLKTEKKNPPHKKSKSVPVPCPLTFPPRVFCKGVGRKWKHSVQLSSLPIACLLWDVFSSRILIVMAELSSLPSWWENTDNIYSTAKRGNFLLWHKLVCCVSTDSLEQWHLIHSYSKRRFYWCFVNFISYASYPH